MKELFSKVSIHLSISIVLQLVLNLIIQDDGMTIPFGRFYNEKSSVSANENYLYREWRGSNPRSAAKPHYCGFFFAKAGL